MDVRSEILYQDSNMENVSLIPIKLERNRIIVKIEKILKRALDILGGIFGSICLIPITIGIWIANKIIGDKGPVFYTQERIGQNGKIFKMYKYRSMVIDADERLEKYLEENEEAREEYREYKKIGRASCRERV